MVKVLGQSPHRWKKIYCLSRRAPAVPGGLPSNAEFISCDFLKKPSEIADTLKKHNVTADALFFYSYVQVPPKAGGGIWSDAEEMTRVNTLLISNLLDAFTIAQITPSRIMLQTGAKNYGVHLGPIRTPQRETDPRVQLESNFYYPQEDAVKSWCEKHAAKYSIGMPCGILGAVPDAAMNLCMPLAIYASIQKVLKEPLKYPGGLNSWQAPQDQSSAMLNGYLEEWSVLTEQTAVGEKYNAVDGSTFTWEGFWPRLAAWYGLDWEGPALDQLKSFPTAYDPPPRGYGGAANVEYSYTFTEWAKQPKVRNAYSQLASEHGLSGNNPLDDADRIFGFLDGMILLPYPLYFSTTKARKRGFFGMVDSEECILEVFNDFVTLKMIPPVPMIGGAF